MSVVEHIWHVRGGMPRYSILSPLSLGFECFASWSVRECVSYRGVGPSVHFREISPRMKWSLD